MEILNIEYADFADRYPVFVLLLILIIGIFLTFGIILLIEENKIIRGILLIIISIVCLCGFTFLVYKQDNEIIDYMEVIFEDSSLINEEFFKNYEIIDVRGKIYQIKEVKTDNRQ